jgi:Cdc6-like AAA superfamily ATPase
MGLTAMMKQELRPKWVEAGSVFTPGSPVNERDLFAGRIPQLNKIIGAISQRGYHAVLFGDRGVGKTSLANMLSSHLRAVDPRYLIGKLNCDANDTFASIWKKALRDITFEKRQSGIGFTPDVERTVTSLADTLDSQLSTDDIRRVLGNLSLVAPTLLILDEYDRITDRSVATLVSDTIKALSDFGVGASILIVGVAESVDKLIEGHQSIERALVQIPMPRMSHEEIQQIFEKGCARLGMELDASARAHLVNLAQGLPYIAHLLALHSSRAALEENSLVIRREHVDRGIQDSLEQWQQSIKSDYYDATKSQQPGSIFREVLLACALAEVDELGYFTAASVRSPLRSITDREYDIPNFSRHLKEFSEKSRGAVLQRTGEKRRLRYRFSSPLMRPYVIIKGHAEKLID